MERTSQYKLRGLKSHLLLHGGSRVAMRQDAEVHYLHGDYLGNTSLTTNAQGNVIHEARYLPFGEPRWQSGQGVTDFTFTAQRDDNFGLMDYNARYYSSRLGRFVSPDSIVPDGGNPQAWNRYSYVENNPTKYVDSSGHCKGLPDWAFGICANVVTSIASGVHATNKWADTTFKRKPAAAAFKAGFSHELPRRFIDQYALEKGDITLANDDMKELSVDINLVRYEDFSRELLQLINDGGGTKYIEFSGLGEANTHGTLGTFTINFAGTLTVGADKKSWSFNGAMDFYDEWNFDPKEDGERTAYGETLVRFANNYLPGQEFKIYSESTPIFQDSSSATASWIGANQPAVPSRIASIWSWINPNNE